MIACFSGPALKMVKLIFCCALQCFIYYISFFMTKYFNTFLYKQQGFRGEVLLEMQIDKLVGHIFAHTVTHCQFVSIINSNCCSTLILLTTLYITAENQIDHIK